LLVLERKKKKRTVLLVKMSEPVVEGMSVDVVAKNGKLFTSDKVYMKNASARGRGVFARCDIKEGETIEVCPVIVIPDDQWEIIDSTDLTNYYIVFGEKDCGIALGYGSLYNHSANPNSRMERRPDLRVVEFIAIRDIKKDEEITFRYLCGGNSGGGKWFAN